MLNVSFLNNYRNFNVQKNQKNNNIRRLSFGKLYAPKLAPLAHDTVSFTSQKANLNKSLYDAFDNINACQSVYENGEIVQQDLTKILESALEGMIDDDPSNPKPELPVSKICARVKKPDSIKEKVAGKLEEAILKDRSKIFNPTNTEDIKHAVGDIVGTRIILQRSETKETKKIIDALIEKVRTGELKITGVKNYEPVDKNLRYFDENDINRLVDEANIANQERDPSSKEIVLKTNPRETGYMALHINLDLSNEEYKTKNNNYQGEIQILGADVERLKDVEDFCYKLRQGKNIKGGHKAYSAFIEYYTNNIDREKYPNIETDIIEYIKKAYDWQRHKEPNHMLTNEEKQAEKYQLPTIEECGLEGKIPPELDFNKLAAIKKLSDALYDEITGTNVTK